jgi:hypothetical protein
MSTRDQSNDESMSDEADLINLWESEDQAAQCATLSDDFHTNKSNHHLTLMLSMTEVEMESDDNDDSFSTMSEYNNDETITATGSCDWDHPGLSRCYLESVPSFYGDDDEDEDYECFEDYRGEELDQANGDDVADDISTSHVSIRTPPQDDPQALMFHNGIGVPNACEVTPEPPSNVTHPLVYVPQLSDVQMQVQRTLRKLACSMRRSDETRIFLKRQRLHYQLNYPRPTSDGETQLNDTNDHNDVNASDDEKLENLNSLGIGPVRCSEYNINDVEVEIDRRKIYQMIQMGLRSTAPSSITINSATAAL